MGPVLRFHRKAREYVRFRESDHPEERWPSGLRRTLGKRVYFNEYRGFESHSLRHYKSYLLELKRKPKKIDKLAEFSCVAFVA
jgi:hypothetical protein